MEGSVQWSGVQSWAKSRPAKFKPGTSWSEFEGANRSATRTFDLELSPLKVYLFLSSLLSGRTTLKQRRFNVQSMMNRRCFNVMCLLGSDRLTVLMVEITRETTVAGHYVIPFDVRPFAGISVPTHFWSIISVSMSGFCSNFPHVLVLRTSGLVLLMSKICYFYRVTVLQCPRNEPRHGKRAFIAYMQTAKV